MTSLYLRITTLSAVGVFGLAALGTPAFAGKVMTVPKVTPPPIVTAPPPKVAAVKPPPVVKPVAPAPITAQAPAPVAAKAP
jgi:hypothetical protein